MSSSSAAQPQCAVHVVFTVKAEHLDAFQQAVLLQAHNSLSREPWCKQFDVCTSPDQPNQIMLYETYEDRAAFAKHRETDHLAEFNRTISDWVTDRQVTIWDIIQS